MEFRVCVARPLKKQGVGCQLGWKSCSFLLSPWRDKFSKLPKLLIVPTQAHTYDPEVDDGFLPAAAVVVGVEQHIAVSGVEHAVLLTRHRFKVEVLHPEQLNVAAPIVQHFRFLLGHLLVHSARVKLGLLDVSCQSKWRIRNRFRLRIKTTQYSNLRRRSLYIDLHDGYQYIVNSFTSCSMCGHEVKRQNSSAPCNYAQKLFTRASFGAMFNTPFCAQNAPGSWSHSSLNCGCFYWLVPHLRGWRTSAAECNVPLWTRGSSQRSTTWTAPAPAPP